MLSRRAAELFHLVFLRALTARLEDKTRVSLKGGCNLRFFFQSIRYSEDIDFDVETIAKTTLAKKVDDLLVSPVVGAPLKAQGLTIVDVTKPKQTQTTQRWKAGIRSESSGTVTRTKIEFSRRSSVSGAIFEAIPKAVTSAYAMPPFLATHYPVREAIVQKIHALADRREPQPRDIFDLNLLLAREPDDLSLSGQETSWLARAIDNAMRVSFDDYSSKVVAYLKPEQAELLASRETWNLMQQGVVERLAALSK